MRVLASLIGTVLLALALAGCAEPSLESQADTLRGDLADLPGVASVRLDYTVPVPFDSGKVALDVEMSDGATADQVVAVTEVAYDAFSTTHHGEEADLTLAAGPTTVALRSFQPRAEVAAVGVATRNGLVAPPEGGSVTVDLTTQDVPRGDHVAGTYVVGLPEGSTAADVPALLESLAADHEETPRIGWGGAAADGSSLTYNTGFPPAELVARWARIQAAGLPLTVRAFDDGSLYADGRLPSTYDLGKRADRRAVNRMVRPQLRALGDGDWTYDLFDSKDRYVVSIDRYLCETSSRGRYGAALEAWVDEALGPCKPR